MNYFLNQPENKKYINDFEWYYEEDQITLTLTFKGLKYDEICRGVGYFFMINDPSYFTDIPQEKIQIIEQIYSFSKKEREIITEIFEFLKYECPLKILKKTIKEANH